MKRDLKNIKKLIFNLYLLKYNKKFNDTDWSNIRKFFSDIKNLDNVKSVNVIDTNYIHTTDFDNVSNPCKIYKVQVITEFGYLICSVYCCCAGTMDNPFDAYDITLDVAEYQDDSLKEAFDYQKTKSRIKEKVSPLVANYNKVKNYLKDVTHWDELTEKTKYLIRAGITAGTIMTVIYTCFDAKEQKIQDLERQLIEMQLLMDNSNVEELSNEPVWKLLTNDVETTVYNAVPAQCNNDVIHTASMFELNMKDVQAHKIIAMERTMMQKFGLHYGNLVKIEGTNGYDGVYQILDTMNKRFKGLNKIDILVNNDIKYGKWQNVKVYLLVNPEECLADLKANMAPAKNQSKMDNKQEKFNKNI